MAKKSRTNPSSAKVGVMHIPTPPLKGPAGPNVDKMPDRSKVGTVTMPGGGRTA